MEEKPEVQPKEIVEEQPKTGFLDKLKIHKFKILGGVLGILVVAGVAFGAYQLGQRRIQPQPSPSPEAVVSPTPDPTADWLIYTNTEYGYSIKYPKDWNTSEPEEGPEEGKRINFHPWQERSLDKVDYQISIIINEADSEITLSSWLDQKIESYPSEVKELITRERIVLNNLEGEKVLEEPSQAGVYNIYTKKGSYVYNFMLAPYSPQNLPQLLPESLDYFNLMLSTFRFLEIPETQDWLTYRSEDYKFSFSYPNNYRLKTLSPLDESYFINNPIPARFELVQNVYLNVGQYPAITLNVVATEKMIEELLSYIEEMNEAAAEDLKDPENIYYGELPPKINSIEEVTVSNIKMTIVERYLGPGGPNPNLLEYYLANSSYVLIFSANYGTYNPDVGQDGVEEKELLPKILTTFQFLD